MRRGRCSLRGGVYFITTVTDERTPWFQEFDLACLMCRYLHSFETLGDADNLCWVVMPDHMHLLIQLRDDSISRVLNRLKSRSAIGLNRLIGRSGRFWARGYHEHALRSEENLLGVARYIVANPLRAGLATSLRKYPYWNAAWL